MPGTSKPLLVIVSGAVPGVGKSELSRALAAEAVASGLDVELFEEQHILERDEFAEVIQEWRTHGRASLESLLAATSSYLDWCSNRQADVCVLDSLLPYLPSLLAWGYSDVEIVEFLARLAEEMHGFEVVEIHLEGDSRMSLERASAREGPGWIEEFVARVATYADKSHEVKTVEDAVKYLDSAVEHSRHLLSGAPWPVRFVNAEAGAAAVLAAAMQVLVFMCSGRR